MADVQGSGMKDDLLAEAIRLIEYATTICRYGERAPGGDENWHQWEKDAARFLRRYRGDDA